MEKKKTVDICSGTIDTALIYATHRQIKAIVDRYQDLNFRVANITLRVNKNWVGAGRNEFESQYELLIRKIEDFGDTLQEIYEALINAEASYEDTDDAIRQDFVMAMDC